jgi:hypothetical protein
MNPIRRLATISLMACLAAGSAFAEPPYSGTIFLDPDIITEEDPSSFVELGDAGQGMRTMFDRRVNGWTDVNAFLFDAHYDDGMRIEVQVNPEFGTLDEARTQALFYAEIFGQLPAALRRDIETSWIHQGDEPFGGGNNNLLIHTGSIAQDYIARGILEETLVHEAAHTSLDAEHADSPGWRAAQQSDPDFISTYARDFPDREDVAESFLLIYALEFRRDRIDDNLAQVIENTIPNRVAYFRNQDLNLYPNGPTAHQAARNDQFWIVGLGHFEDQTLIIDEATSTSGGVFGENFDAQSIQHPIWGSISIEWTSCATADLSWVAVPDAVKDFGQGGYPLTRVAPNAGQRDCESSGFGSNPDHSWVSGSWFGGPSRSGEGILIDVLEDDVAFLAWFTYGDE